uniref:Uncharacterized protein n=1 Tax=Anguilla anguilla TaxID=7936 RepID=A0A0E9U198_ANGAN
MHFPGPTHEKVFGAQFLALEFS